jgi:hypothetical protein
MKTFPGIKARLLRTILNSPTPEASTLVDWEIWALLEHAFDEYARIWDENKGTYDVPTVADMQDYEEAK